MKSSYNKTYRSLVTSLPLSFLDCHLNNISSILIEILIETAYHVCPLGVLQGHSKGLHLNRSRDNCQSCVVPVRLSNAVRVYYSLAIYRIVYVNFLCDDTYGRIERVMVGQMPALMALTSFFYSYVTDTSGAPE